MQAPTPSATHQELEFKWAISKEDAANAGRLLGQRWGSGTIYHQHNRFFDSPENILREQRMSVRLRRENERVVLTCKQRKGISSALHHQQEEEIWVNMAMWNACCDASSIDAMALPLPPRIRQLLGTGELRNLGGFFNLRQQWIIDNEVICLDHSHFSEHYDDHEIEIEIAESANASAREAYWRKTFGQMGITLMPQPHSKLHRFSLQEETP